VKSNLRELVESEMRAHGDSCKCIRCREVGIKMAKENILPDPESIKLQRIDYDASGGKEVFLSFEETSNKLLIGFLRLRKPSEDAHLRIALRCRRPRASGSCMSSGRWLK